MKNGKNQDSLSKSYVEAALAWGQSLSDLYAYQICNYSRALEMFSTNTKSYASFCRNVTEMNHTFYKAFTKK